MLRVGIQESIALELLQDFTREVELVRIADELRRRYGDSTCGSRPSI